MKIKAPKSKSKFENTAPLSPLPPPTMAIQGTLRFALPLLLILYLAFASYHAMTVPTGQTGYQDAPDEAAHVTFVRTLAGGRLPTQAQAAADPLGYEWHQPPLYYALCTKLLRFGPRTVRLVSIVCGFIGIVLIFQIARLLVPDEPLTAIVAAGIAALTPSHIAITSTVNNDALLEVCMSASVLLLLQSLRSGFTMWRAGWLGMAIGAACLTKATGVLLLPVLLFALFLYYRSGETPKSLMQNAVWCMGIVFAVCGWWYVRNAALYGEFLPVQAFNRAFVSTTQSSDVISGRVGLQVDGKSGYLALVGQWTFQSFWAVFGTPRSALAGKPEFLFWPVYALLCAVTTAMAVGLTLLHYRRIVVFNEMQIYGMWLLFTLFGLVGLSFFGFILHYFQTQGRYLYPAMSAICTLGALGWLALFPAKYKGLAAGGLLALLLAVCGIYFGR